MPTTRIKFDSSAPSDAVFLAKFPSGTPPAACLAPSGPDAIRFHAFQSDDSRPAKSMHRALIGDSDRVEYTGKNFGESNRLALNSSKFAVCVYEPGHSTVKLLETNHMFHIRSRVKALQSVPESFMDEKSNYAEMQASLIDQFGSRKRKSQLKSKAANKVTLQEDIAHALHSTLQENKDAIESSVAPDEEEMLLATKELILPPYELKAETPAGIYPMEGIISDRELKMLNGEQLITFAKDPDALESFLKGKSAVKSEDGEEAETAADEKPKRERGGYISDFVRRRLPYLLQLPKENQGQVSALLQYVNLLLYFRRGNPKSKFKSFPFGLNEGIKEKILHEFSEKRRRVGEDGESRVDFVLSSSFQKKLTCYILIVALHACRFYLDPDDLGALVGDMKMLVTELIQYCKEIGCTLANKTAGAKLTAPLTLPKLRRAKKAKKN